MPIPTTGVQHNDYTGVIREMYCGLQQRARAANGCGFWPASNTVWESGVAGAITENEDGSITMVDATPIVPAPTVPGDPPERPPKNWTMPPGTGLCPTSGASKWVGFHDECSCFIPDFYDVVFEVGGEWDETKIVRGQITAHTAPEPGPGVHPSVTFTGRAIRNAVVGGFIPSVGALAGKRYYFIKRGGMFWSDVSPDGSKWLPFPNDPELWRDNATEGSEKYLRAAINRIAGPTVPQAWSPDQWAGAEVLAYDGGNNLRRLTVVWNDADALYFVPKPDPEGPPEDQMPPGWVDPAPAYALSGVFTIVPPGSRGDPYRWSPQVGAWNTGATRPAFSHYPGDASTPPVYGNTENNGVLVLHDAIATNVQWDEGSPCNPTFPTECVAVNHPKPPDTGHAYDFDLWSDWQEECGAPGASDKNWSPRFFWAIGGLQRECVRLCVFYIDHTVANPGGLSPLTPATYFHLMGVNSGTSAVAEDSPNVFSAAVDAKYNGYRLWWAVKNADGSVRLSGQSYAAAGKIGLSADLWNATEAASDPPNRGTGDVGKTVVYSAGFTRGDNNGHGPLEVRYLYPKGPVFVADVNNETIPPGPIDPASVGDFDEDGCAGVGSYHVRAASASFLDHTEDGITIDGAAAIVDDLPFRYVGDAWHDPSVRVGDSSGSSAIITSDTDEGNAKYWDRFYQGTHAAQPQALIESIRVGDVDDDGAEPVPNAITDGRSFKIKGAADLRSSWHGGGLMRTESGTASGGSTTTVIDNHKLTTDATGCFVFAGGRWPNGKPHVGLILRITSGPDAGLKRPIIDAVADFGSHTVTYTLAYALPHAVGSGVTYAIEEPHEANPFQRRCLRVYDPEPATTFHDLIVSHSDADTLWYDETFSPAPGSRWAIIEPRTGGVWKRTTVAPAAGTLYVKADATHWYVPVSGADPRGQPWHAESSENLPYLGAVKYGYVMKGDYRTTQVLRELWTAINTLKWLMTDVTWSNRESAYQEFPDVNCREASFTTDENRCGASDPEHPDAQDSYDDYWSCVDAQATAYWNDLLQEIPCEGTCSGGFQVSDMPSAWSIGRADESGGVFTGDVALHRSYLYALVEKVPTCMPFDVEIWAKAKAAMFELAESPYFDDVSFDTMGDGGFAENQWGVILSGAPNVEGSTARVRVGAQDPQSIYGPYHRKPPLRKPVLNSGHYLIRGYQLVDAVAILKPTFTCCVEAAPEESDPAFFESFE
jgi:hypothetical protein